MESYEVKLDNAINEVIDEFWGATQEFRPMNSAHEGYATILEELDELWGEIKKKPGEKDINLMRIEAKQVAAKAIRFMIDICE